MKKFFAVVRLATLSGLALSLLQACPSGPTQTAQACKLDTDCDPGLLCEADKCVEYLSCPLREKGCTTDCGTAATGASCLLSADCKTGDACVENKCTTSSKCPDGEFCAETDRGSTCRTLGCRVASDCKNGEVCIDSQCGAPTVTVPDSCEIANLATTFAKEATGIKVLAVAYKNDEVIPYLKPSGLTTTGGHFTADATAGTISGVPGATAGGQDTVTASFTGNITCTKTFTLAADVNGSRVVLYTNSVTGGVGPVSGLTSAHITYFDVAGAAIATTVVETPSGSGVYNLTAGVSAPVGIHIVHPNYSAATYYFGTASANFDIALPLEKLAETTGFGGKPDFGDFDKEFSNLAKAEIKGAYASASLPLSSLLNFSLDLFAGDLAPKNIDASVLTGGGSVGACTPVSNATAAKYGTTCANDAACATDGATGLVCQKANSSDPTGTCSATVPLPRALFASINEKGLIGPNCDGVVVRSLAGRRTAWSIGTKVPLSKVTSFASFLSGGPIDIAKILSAALPLLDNFAFGADKITPPSLVNRPISDWNAFRVKTAADLDADNNFGFATIRPARRLKFIENFKNTNLIANDFYAGAPSTEKLNGVVTLITTISPAYGLVPIGFGAGFDSENNGTFDTLPGVDTRFAPNAVHARYAAPAKELSDNEIIAVTVGTNLTDLTRETPNSKSTRLKGVVSRNTTTRIGFSNSELPSLTGAVEGIVFPAAPTYVKGTNTLTLPAMTKEAGAPAADAVVLRVSRDTVALTWNVIIKPGAIGASPLVLPTIGLVGGDTIISDDAGESELVLATTALRFGAGFSFETSFSPKSGKDLDALAGEVSSFSLYYARANRQ
jgi:hypothetical protein